MSCEAMPTNTGYQLGRLFALLDGMERNSRADTHVSHLDRYMRIASTTPARIFPQIFRTAQPNSAKMHRLNRVGLASWFNCQIAEVLEEIGGTFPASLSLEDQCHFFSGYYQQAHRKISATETHELDPDE